MNNNVVKVGDCECCPTSVGVSLYQRPVGLVCEGCRDREDAAVAKSEATHVENMVETSRKIDQAIQLKKDIFIAKTVAATELRGAIFADANIPDDQKEYVFAKECHSRMMHFQKVVFDQRQALLESENEMRMWQANVQSSAGKLRADKRAEFRSLDVNYEPVTPKPTKSSNKAPNLKKQELVDAAKKYNLSMSHIRMMSETRKISADQAGRELAEMLKKKAQ